MKIENWLQYYTGIVARGGMKDNKVRELVANCGGQVKTLVPDPDDSLKEIEVLESFAEAVERIKGEILELTSRENLERKADEIIVELRRR